MELLRFWILGIIVNLFLTYSMIQIYFRSSNLSISRTHVGNVSSEIKRVVFFVADGLRADTFFANPKSRPRLENIILSGPSVIGTSVSEAPTDSRPGFVRMFAGLQQDPSAQPLLWSSDPNSNPDDFDIVFNRTDFNVLIGYVKVPLKQFTQGPGQQKIYTEVYDPNSKHRTMKTLSDADDWVLEKFDTTVNLKVLPLKGKILVVLHLIGTDQTGHILKPHSLGHLASITAIDKIVAHVESKMSDYYGDNMTMYIFTSDHGMTDDPDDKYGKHGGGSRAEIETPIVIWGNGIKNTGENLRMEQVDITAFLSGALNIPYPVHSVGRFPFPQVWQNKSFAFEALRANLGQLLELMNSKRNFVNVGMLPFSWFPGEDEIVRLMKLSNSAGQKLDYKSAIDYSSKASALAVKGIKYYAKYEEFGLASILTVYTYVVWIFLIKFALITLERKEKLGFVSVSVLIMIDTPVSALCTKWIFGWSMWRIPYVLLPLYLTQLLHSTLKLSQINVWATSSSDLQLLFGLLVSSAVGKSILVATLHQRGILALGLLLIGIWSMNGKTLNIWKRFLWIGSLAALSIFPNLPVVGITRNPVFVTLGPVTCGMLSLWSLAQYSGQAGEPRKCEIGIVYFQAILSFSVYFLIHFPGFVITRFVSWTSLMLSFTAPFFISENFLSLRITSIFLAISTPLLFLSCTYDSLFYPILFVTLTILTKMEVMDETDTWINFWCLTPRCGYGSGELGIVDAFRRAWLLILFSYMSFFGTGSVYTIADMRYDKLAQCFLNYPLDFKKNVMFAAYKLVGPLLLVACFFRLLVTSRREWIRILLVTLFLSQTMAIYKFFDILNDLGPMTVGVSIAHSVIPQVMTLCLAVLYRVACFLTGLPPHT